MCYLKKSVGIVDWALRVAGWSNVLDKKFTFAQLILRESNLIKINVLDTALPEKMFSHQSVGHCLFFFVLVFM